MAISQSRNQSRWWWLVRSLDNKVFIHVNSDKDGGERLVQKGRGVNAHSCHVKGDVGFAEVGRDDKKPEGMKVG